MSTTPTTLSEQIEAFLAESPIGVVGASSDPSKYGYRCLHALLEKGLEAIPVNPKGGEILGVSAVTSIADLPAGIRAINVITPPVVTESVIDAAIAHGITRIWLQPGAEPIDAAIERARAAGIDVISHGPCILVALASR